MRTARGQFTAFAVLTVLSLAAAANAQGVSPDVRSRLEAAAASSRALTQNSLALGQSLQNPALARTLAENAAQNADTAISTVVVTEISRQPRAAEEIVAAALAIAPASRSAILAAATAAFPANTTRLASTPGANLGVPAVQLVGAAPSVPPRSSGALTPRTATPLSGVGAASTRTPLPTEAAVAPSSAPPGQLQRGPRRLPPGGASGPETISDPLEGYNRAMFAVNDVFDTFVLRPIAATYGYVTPTFAKEGVRRAINNINSPVILANDLLQIDSVGAGITVGRFAINSTIGLLGLIDVAASFGLEPHHADFGQTMHRYGVGVGPYLVLPVLGPATLRDLTGRGVDIFFDPLTYILTTGQSLAVGGTKGLVKREELLMPLEELRASAVDYYAALRSAYYQNRAVELGLANAGSSSRAVDKLFDEAE